MMALRDLRRQQIRRSPEELVAHLDGFQLVPRFSVGVWYFSQMASRFHEKYGSDIEIQGRLDIIASLKEHGVEAVEAHYPAEIHEENIELWKTFCQDTGIRLLTIIPGLFYDRQFEFGSLSSPLPDVRRRAVARLITTLRLNREFNTDFAVLWPGIDGYENPFAIDLVSMRRRFAEGLAEAMDTVPGVRIAFEPKPYEPRGRILYGTTAEGLLLASDVEDLLKHPENRALLNQGHALLALNPEAGHMLMSFEDLAYSFGLACEHARLAHTHWNSQPLGNYDQDLNVGVVSPEQTEAALYALKMHGYQEHFGVDVNPERMPVDVAVRNSLDALRAASDRVNTLDHDQIIWAVTHPDRSRGWLEAYMIRQRASNPGALRPLAPLSRE